MSPISPERAEGLIRAAIDAGLLPTAKVTMVAQWVGVAVSLLVLLTDLFSSKWKAIILSVVIVLKAIQAGLAQYSNPNGTHASEPWNKEAKQ